MFSFNRSYIIAIVFMLLVLAALDLVIKHPFLHAVLSNIIMIVMLYALVKAFWNVKPIIAGILVLLLVFAIEIAPYIHFADPSLHKRFITIAPGFDFWYKAMTNATGIVLALMTERAIHQNKQKGLPMA
jgi:hypothetical protein